MMILFLILVKFFYFYNKVRIQKNYIYTVLLSTMGLTTVVRLLYHLSIIGHFDWWIVLYSIASVVMFIDVIYFAHFNQLTTVNLLKQITQLTTVGDSLLVLMEPSMFLLIWDVVLLPFLPDSWQHFLIKGLDYRVLFLYLALFLCILLYFKKAKQVFRQELFLYHGKDIVESVGGVEKAILKWKVNPRDLEKHRFVGDESHRYHGVAKDKNILMIQVEALQNILLFQEYNGQVITPNLNAFAEESLYFPKFFQSIGRGNTSDAEFTVLNSIYPSIKAPTFMEFTGRRYGALPKLLTQRGYQTAVFHGNQKHYYNRDRMYPKLGFQTFYGEEDFSYDMEKKIGFGINDEDFLEQTADYLETMDQKGKFFAFVITLSSHTPFYMPRQYVDFVLKDEDKNTMLGRYMEAIHYTDKALGKFLGRLREKNLWDQSLILLYGDHFALSACHGDEAMDAARVFQLDHGYGYDHMMNIPLIMHCEGMGKGRWENIGSQMDLYPTLLNLLGERKSPGVVFGKDMFNTEDHLVIPPGYVHYGSFITKDVFVEAGLDGEMDSARARSLFRHDPADVSAYEKTYAKVLEELALSRYALIHDKIME